MPDERPKILVVDDDRTMLKLLEKKFMVEGFDFIGAPDGKTCLGTVKNDAPDLILLDMIIPDISGREIVRKLRSDPDTQKVPIIFITATISDDNSAGAAQIDVDGESFHVFAKPLHNPELFNEIRKQLAQS